MINVILHWLVFYGQFALLIYLGGVRMTTFYGYEEREPEQTPSEVYLHNSDWRR